MLFVTFEAYTLLLHAIYVDTIAPAFYYLGYTHRAPDPLSYATICVLGGLLAALMPLALQRPSQMVLWLHFVVATAPSMLIPQYSTAISHEQAFLFGVLVAVSWCMVIFLCSGGVSVGRKLALHRQPHVGGLVWPLLGGWSVLVLFYLFVILRLPPQLVALTNVAPLRLSFRVVLGQNSAVLAYALLITSNVVHPALILRGTQQSGKRYLFLGITGQILLYSITGYKMVLLSVPAILGLAWWSHRGKHYSGGHIQLGITILMAVAYAVQLISGYTALTLIFVTRMIVTPGLLSAAYVGIFSVKPEVRWSYSFMSWLFRYPYADQPAYLVGAAFSGSAQTSANVNMFADGYMNLRWAGVTIECLVFVVILWTIDGVSKGLPLAVPAAICLVPTIALTNSSIFTSITSHGFLAAIVVLALLPREPSVELPSSKQRRPSPVSKPTHTFSRRSP
jgi:hypothetical protein